MTKLKTKAEEIAEERLRLDIYLDQLFMTEVDKAAFEQAVRAIITIREMEAMHPRQFGEDGDY